MPCRHRRGEGAAPDRSGRAPTDRRDLRRRRHDAAIRGRDDVGVRGQKPRELRPLLCPLVELTEALADVGALRVCFERTLERVLHALLVTELLASAREAERDLDGARAARGLEQARESAFGFVPGATSLREARDGLERLGVPCVSLEDLLVDLERATGILHPKLEGLAEHHHA